MTIDRREFLNLTGSLMGGWVLTWIKPVKKWNLERSLIEMSDLAERLERYSTEGWEAHHGDTDFLVPGNESSPAIEPELEEIGHFNPISPTAYAFDENKYSPSKRKIEPSQWGRTNRHLPIRIDPSVINKPGERSPQALQRVVDYIPFNGPRYVAAAGERVSMCNIAAWDWSRALQLHLPHWIGETEMSANMLYRWISHPQAGGIYGEGWQPVEANAARLLANWGIPVFALAENTRPGRHGHVAMVYPGKLLSQEDDGDWIYFATVTNGRSRGGNGIKRLGNTFRNLKPTYFVHKIDFILNRDA